MTGQREEPLAAAGVRWSGTQEDEFGTGISWLWVSFILLLCDVLYCSSSTWASSAASHWCVSCSMLLSVLGKPTYFYSAMLSKSDLNCWNLVGDMFYGLFSFFFFFLEENGQEFLGIEDSDKHPALDFHMSFGISLPVRGLQHTILLRVRLNWNQLLIKFMSKLINHNYSDHVHMNNFYYGEHNY